MLNPRTTDRVSSTNGYDSKKMGGKRPTWTPSHLHMCAHNPTTLPAYLNHRNLLEGLRP